MVHSPKSVVITGASRGIGREIARSFARQAEVGILLIARSQAGLEETKALCLQDGSTDVAIAVCDASRPEEVAGLGLPDDFPSPSILINNAGSFLLKSLATTTPAEFEEQMQANLYSAVHITQHFLDELKQQEQALIVNICSVGAVEGLKDSGAYAASKHALLGYSRSLRQELLHTSVGVTAINLGQTQSTSWEGSSVDGDRLIDPTDIGKLIVVLSRLSSRTVAEEILIKPQHGRVPPM